MPLPTHPLTPLSSMDISGKDCPPEKIGVSLKLPPPAIKAASRAELAIHDHAGETSNAPSTPGTHCKRKRASEKNDVTTETRPSAFALPPPPTRPRTIIQMQPRFERRQTESQGQSRGKPPARLNRSNPKKASNGGTNGAKRASRKTAHSVIEKRRRSKMNEEFDTMKEMIPACKGQTMHKLAILQAGIDYLRYLELCISELKAARSQNSLSLLDIPIQIRQASDRIDVVSHGTASAGSVDEDEDKSEFEYQYEDEDHARGSQYNDLSPMLSSCSGSAASNGTVWSTAATSLPASPNVTMVLQSRHSSVTSDRRFCQLSKAAEQLPHAADLEATTALLMLTGSQRQQPAKQDSRGLSVQDLLSG